MALEDNAIIQPNNKNESKRYMHTKSKALPLYPSQFAIFSDLGYPDSSATFIILKTTPLHSSILIHTFFRAKTIHTRVKMIHAHKMQSFTPFVTLN